MDHWGSWRSGEAEWFEASATVVKSGDSGLQQLTTVARLD
jgi:hypothetical protein